ncbi:uncharacterized protein [Panulirus ornatus]|uniref:uncharacterized protein n=1 Tax=Panulirus ornatus TaxID=150431 RepID=UPI003A887EEE
MAGRRMVNVATITEEDVVEEEIGEDGMVETVVSTLERTRPEEKGCPSPTPSSTASDHEANPEHRVSLERPSSLVENEDAEASNNNLILNAITFESDGGDGGGGGGGGSLPRPSRIPKISNSQRRSSSPSAVSPVRKPYSKRGNRGSGFTMNLSDRFVTELTLYDPSSGPAQSSSVCLGVFLATDQVMGDHSVYKVSPVSPLSVLKIKPHDRILKLNDISLAGWSHSCVLEFVRNLPLTSISGQVTPDTAVEFGLSMEYRRAGKNVRSSDEAPVNRRIVSRVKIRKRRATVTSIQEGDVRVQYRTTRDRKLNGSSNSSSDSGISSLGVCEETCPSSSVCFRLHTFDQLPSAPEDRGEVVVFQGSLDDSYLHATSPTGLALMHGVVEDVKSLTQVDVRFFLLLAVPKSKFFRIKNLDTGRFVSASREEGVTLVAQEQDFELPKSTLFEVVPDKD